MTDMTINLARAHNGGSGDTVPAIKVVDMGDGTYSLAICDSQAATIITLLTELNAKIDAGITVTVVGGL